MRVLSVVLTLLSTTPASALSVYADTGLPIQQIQYGGGWGVCGPYGCPPPGAYGYPRGYPRDQDRPRYVNPPGPDPEACIYGGYCRGMGPRPDYYPRGRDYRFPY